MVLVTVKKANLCDQNNLIVSFLDLCHFSICGLHFIYYLEKTSTQLFMLARLHTYIYTVLLNKGIHWQHNENSIVFHDLIPPIRARYIRFRPTAWHQHISMRVELYGCCGCLLYTSPSPRDA